ncbi:hypothetical protein F2P81_024737 [Scophthalmus maximus]|uniref:Uncharacterized protein n=1 Tax=Scophthalmus maximus TaxID=52904 RepID=A0A6A4RJU6_SCOMX|nr:hypothetical protein F2P81_024737 [Scophthalmus maximus]
MKNLQQETSGAEAVARSHAAAAPQASTSDFNLRLSDVPLRAVRHDRQQLLRSCAGGKHWKSTVDFIRFTAEHSR